MVENIQLSPLQDNKIKNVEELHPTSEIDKDKMVIRRNGDTVYFDLQKRINCHDKGIFSKRKFLSCFI